MVIFFILSTLILIFLRWCLRTWKDRLPNEHDSLRVWEDLILWRNHMFSAIHTNFQWTKDETLATLHDRPWTSIRMAKTARKHGMKEVNIYVNNNF